jgi:CBS domain containing-hemolysin-like protein
MIPRSEIVTVDKDLQQSELFTALDEHEYIRYPVTEARNTDRLIGFINTKELLTSMAVERIEKLQAFIHKMPRFIETTSI